MSDLSLNISPSPELLNAATAGGLKGPDAPDSPATNPFAALLSGVLQGSQPVAIPEASPVSPEAPPDLDAEATELLALPASATATPAPPGSSTGNTELPGTSLPATGRILPVVPEPPHADGAVKAATGPVVATTDPPSPRISLADLNFSRQLDTAPAESGATGPAIDPTTDEGAALALAGRALSAGRAARAGSRLPDASASTPAQPALPALANSDGPAPLASPAGAEGLLMLRMSRTDPAPAAGTAPNSGPSVLPGFQLAAFALGTDSAPARSGGPGADGASLSAGGGPLSGPVAGQIAGQIPGLANGGTLSTLQPLGAPGAFAGGLADRLLTLGGPGAHSARLKLHPESLGELDVEIKIDDGRAQVWFGTSSSQAREAIENSLPRLRELFADQGLQLTRSQVDTSSGQTGSGAGGHMAGNGFSRAESGWRTSADSRPLSALPALARAAAPNRLLDVWA